MGAKTSFLVFSDGDVRGKLRSAPVLDRDATLKLTGSLFPGVTLRADAEASLQWTYPRGGQVFAGCFPGVSIVASDRFAIDHPSKLPAKYLAPGAAGTVHLHVMHSVVDWFAFAVWNKGVLRRSLSATPESGEPARMILEDIGERLSFESPFWAGERPLDDEEEGGADATLPFHPLEFGEAALFEFFGYQLEGDAPALFDPESIKLLVFDLKPWWRFW